MTLCFRLGLDPDFDLELGARFSACAHTQPIMRPLHRDGHNHRALDVQAFAISHVRKMFHPDMKAIDDRPGGPRWILDVRKEMERQLDQHRMQPFWEGFRLNNCERTFMARYSVTRRRHRHLLQFTNQ